MSIIFIMISIIILIIKFVMIIVFNKQIYIIITIIFFYVLSLFLDNFLSPVMVSLYSYDISHSPYTPNGPPLCHHAWTSEIIIQFGTCRYMIWSFDRQSLLWTYNCQSSINKKKISFFGRAHTRTRIARFIEQRSSNEL